MKRFGLAAEDQLLHLSDVEIDVIHWLRASGLDTTCSDAHVNGEVNSINVLIVFKI